MNGVHAVATGLLWLGMATLGLGVLVALLLVPTLSLGLALVALLATLLAAIGPLFGWAVLRTLLQIAENTERVAITPQPEQGARLEQYPFADESPRAGSIACGACGRLNPIGLVECRRCGAALPVRQG